MLIRLDTTGTAPLHERIAAAVRRAVAEGEVEVGERLPAAKDLAATLDVNVNTVLRSYRELRDEGLLELRRGRGATVLRGAVGRAALQSQADALIAEARRLGLSPDEVGSILEERW